MLQLLKIFPPLPRPVAMRHRQWRCTPHCCSHCPPPPLPLCRPLVLVVERQRPSALHPPPVVVVFQAVIVRRPTATIVEPWCPFAAIIYKSPEVMMIPSLLLRRCRSMCRRENSPSSSPTHTLPSSSPPPAFPAEAMIVIVVDDERSTLGLPRPPPKHGRIEPASPPRE